MHFLIIQLFVGPVAKPGYGVGLLIRRSQVRFLPGPLQIAEDLLPIFIFKKFYQKRKKNKWCSY